MALTDRDKGSIINYRMPFRLWLSVPQDPLDVGDFLSLAKLSSATVSGQSIALELITETSTLNAFTSTKQKEIGLISETSTLFSIIQGLFVELGLITETSTVQAFGKAKQKEIGLISASESLLSITHGLSEELGLITETSTLFAFTHTKQKAIGLITETSTVLAFAQSSGVFNESYFVRYVVGLHESI